VIFLNNNLNLDENTMKNIKNMVDNGNLSEAISQISPEMIQNVSKMLNNSSNSTNNNNSNTSTKTVNSTNNAQNDNASMNFNNIDPNTIMKITSAFGKMNNKNDPRANLLYSLKPYLRDGKKEKLDQYVNLLNVTKIAEIMKDNKKEN
jgi:hypothetical protein